MKRKKGRVSDGNPYSRKKILGPIYQRECVGFTWTLVEKNVLFQGTQ